MAGGNKMGIKRKLPITQDDYELEIWKDSVSTISIYIGINDGSMKKEEHVISFNHEQIDLLIDTLIELRFE